MGVHSSLIQLLQRLYQSGSTYLLVNGSRVPIDVKRGVRQGDVLSPKLFNATLSYAINRINWEDEGIRINGQHLHTLGYADDIVLFSRSRPGMERMLHKLIGALGSVGLEINTKKTVLLSNIVNKTPIIINGSNISFVDNFVFLGSQISIPLDDSEEVKRKMGQAFGAFNKISNLLTCRQLTMKKRKLLFDSCVTPVALYAAETWTLKESDKRYIEVSQRRMERRMLRITSLDRWQNERIRARTKLVDWRKRILCLKMTWAEKITQMNGNRWARTITEWTPLEGKRSRGGRRQRWEDEIRELAGTNWWHRDAEEWKILRSTLVT